MAALIVAVGSRREAAHAGPSPNISAARQVRIAMRQERRQVESEMMKSDPSQAGALAAGSTMRRSGIIAAPARSAA